MTVLPKNMSHQYLKYQRETSTHGETYNRTDRQTDLVFFLLVKKIWLCNVQTTYLNLYNMHQVACIEYSCHVVSRQVILRHVNSLLSLFFLKLYCFYFFFGGGERENKFVIFARA